MGQSGVPPQHGVALRRYPRSFFALALTGIAIASLPVLIALASAAFSLQRLAGQSREALHQTALAARASRQLAEQATGMERIARQYLILDDDSMLESYRRLRAAFKATTSELSLLPLDDAQLQELNRAIDSEAAIWEQLSRNPGGPSNKAAIVDGLVELAEVTKDIVDQSNALINREVERLNDNAAHAQAVLALLLAASLPVAAALAFGFAWLTARPVRDLDQAVRRLGLPDLGAEIQVEGPRDIEALGERLEWLRRRLGELEEQKSNFLHHVSHELKTPLTAMREGAELLADGSAGPLNPAQRDIAGILRTNSLRLQKLVTDLLAYHRAADARIQLDLASVDIAQVIRATLEAHRLTAEARGLRFDTRLEPVGALADADKLRVIVDNLVSNAVNFSPDGGTVSVLLAARENMAVIDVIDNGGGVAAEDRERIFDWFFQGRVSSAGRIKGSGLGLAIAREWAVAHGGTIQVLGDAPGAHFQVKIPARPAAATA